MPTKAMTSLHHNNMKTCSTILYSLIENEFRLPINLRAAPPAHMSTQKRKPPTKLPMKNKFSTNNEEVQRMIMSEGYSPELCTKQFYHDMYTNLSLSKLNIRVIDPEILRFQKLTYLGVMCNLISVLENLPPAVIEVQASFNCITNFRQHPPLERLSVVKNGLDQQNVRQIVAYYPALTYLDLSHNHLKSLPTLILHLQKLQGLVFLGLQGNPLQSPQNYRGLVQALPGLKFIDGQNVQEVAGGVMLTQPQEQGERKQDGSMISEIAKGLAGEDEEEGLGSMLGQVQGQDISDL